MTEHVHEWRIDAYRDDDNELTIGVFCWHKGCNEQRSRSEAEAMLNATERLSAKVARRNGVILRLNADKLSYGTQTQGYSDSVDLMAYADILEGK